MLLGLCLLSTLCLTTASGSQEENHVLSPKPKSTRLPKNLGNFNPANIGLSVASGDLNGDGIDEIVAGAPLFEESGGLLVIDGATLEVIEIVRPSDPAEQVYFGRSVAVDDLDGDGLDDLVVGARGCTILIFSRTGVRKVLDFSTIVVGVGDANGDRHSDVFIAAGRGDGSAGNVFLGPSFETRVDLRLPGSVSGVTGLVVADLNNDGLDDAFLAHSTHHYGEGICWFSFAPAFEQNFFITDPEPIQSGRFGNRIDATDFNQDGATDLLVTSKTTPCSYFDLCRDCLVFWGPDFTEYYQVTDLYLGWTTGLGVWAGIADFNADGYPDVCSVASIDADGYQFVPEYYVYFGPELTTFRTFSFSDRDQRDSNTSFGRAMRSADIDQDGRDEFLVGDPRSSLFGNSYDYISGVVHLVDFSSHIAFRPFGDGFRGHGAFEPTLRGAGDALPGSIVDLRVKGGRKGAVGVLLVGTAPASEALCDNDPILGKTPFRHVDPHLSYPFVLEGTEEYGEGSWEGRLGIPPNPELPGEFYFVQALISEPGGPCGMSGTNGLRITVQR